jgi:hypothetical protein
MPGRCGFVSIILKVIRNGMVFFIYQENRYMKQFMQIVRRPMLAIVSLLMTVVAFAQDKQVDVNINTNSGGNWYAQPWVWIVGVAVFILLLVALTRSGSRSDA